MKPAATLETESHYGMHTQKNHELDLDLFLIRFFVIAILSTMTLGAQNYLFASSASVLTSRLRSLSFKAILRQDSE